MMFQGESGGREAEWGRKESFLRNVSSREKLQRELHQDRKGPRQGELLIMRERKGRTAEQ